jgi:hypothetical protein
MYVLIYIYTLRRRGRSTLYKRGMGNVLTGGGRGVSVCLSVLYMAWRSHMQRGGTRGAPLALGWYSFGTWMNNKFNFIIVVWKRGVHPPPSCTLALCVVGTVIDTTTLICWSNQCCCFIWITSSVSVRCNMII